MVLFSAVRRVRSITVFLSDFSIMRAILNKPWKLVERNSRLLAKHHPTTHERPLVGFTSIHHLFSALARG